MSAPWERGRESAGAVEVTRTTSDGRTVSWSETGTLAEVLAWHAPYERRWAGSGRPLAEIVAHLDRC